MEYRELEWRFFPTFGKRPPVPNTSCNRVLLLPFHRSYFLNFSTFRVLGSGLLDWTPWTNFNATLCKFDDSARVQAFSVSPLIKNDMQQLSNQIKFNVGGKIFDTSDSTLKNLGPGNMLATMVDRARSGQIPTQLDPEGRIILDRDPVIFEMMLNWGRSKVWDTSVPVSPQAIQAELDYYGVTAIEFVKRMDIEEIRPQDVPNLQPAPDNEMQRLLDLAHNSFERRIVGWLELYGPKLKLRIQKAAAKGKVQFSKKFSSDRLLRKEYALDRLFFTKPNSAIFKRIVEQKVLSFFGLQIGLRFSFHAKQKIWKVHFDASWMSNGAPNYCVVQVL
jgi:hypothetical protein